MVEETIFSSWIFSEILLPFLLIFFILFAIIEKTKIFGENKKQLNALISFIVSLIFTVVIREFGIIENLILFLVIAVIVVFVILLVWGFIVGGEAKFDSKAVKIIAGILVSILVIIVLIFALGWQNSIIEFLFKGEWSKSFWTNFLFIGVLAGAIALVLAKSKPGSS
jgi:hypothetical protein